jgi:hypothetical protein
MSSKSESQSRIIDGDGQMRAAVAEVHLEEERSAWKPIAAIVRHERCVPASEKGGVRCAFSALGPLSRRSIFSTLRLAQVRFTPVVHWNVRFAMSMRSPARRRAGDDGSRLFGLEPGTPLL